MNRRTFLKRIFYSTISFLGLSGGSYYYAKHIEPGLLSVKNKVIHSKYLPLVFDDFRIVQFSDTHLGFHYDETQLTKLVHTINKLNPNAIVFTGDLVDNPDTYNWTQNLTNILKSLSASHGKYWVYGNHDHGGYGTEIIKDTMNHAEFKLLKNSHEKILKDGKEIVILGTDDLILGTPNLEKALLNTNESDFKILLSHEPDYATTARSYPIDLQLSGHSHGGQVRLPFIGSLYTPNYATLYTSGSYTFETERLKLYVNNGIGTTRLPFRFLCKPEITVFHLKHDEN